MIKNRVNSKYIPIIFIGLFFSFLFRGAYSMYVDFATIEDTRAANIALQAIYSLFEYGAIPALLCYFITAIIYSIGFRHGARFMTKSDFTALACALIAIMNAALGVVDIFAILAPLTDVVIATAEPALLFVVLIIFFMVSLSKKYQLNPVEKTIAFKSYFMWLLIVQGIEVALADGVYFLIARSGLEAQLAQEYGIIITRAAEIVALADVCILAAEIIAFVIILYVLKAKAEDYAEKRRNGIISEEEEERRKPRDPDIFVFDDGEKDDNPFDSEINGDTGKDKNGSDSQTGGHDDIDDIFDL